MKEKIIFTDVDGTLIPYDSQIPPESEYVAFKKAKENGHKIFFVTGRTLAHIERPLQDLQPDGIIGGNGAFIKVGNDIIFEQTIPVDDVLKITKDLEKLHMEFFIEAVNGIYGSHNYKRVFEKSMRAYGQKEVTLEAIYPSMTFPESYAIERVTKINYYLNDYQDYLMMKSLYPNYKCLTWGGAGENVLYGDIAARNISKATSIAYLMNDLGVKKEDTIGIGDAEVDLPMFAATGFSICMGNGRAKAKAGADYITDACEDDGIYHAFRHLHLI